MRKHAFAGQNTQQLNILNFKHFVAGTTALCKEVLTLYIRYNKSDVHSRLCGLWGKKCCIVESVLEPKPVLWQEVLEVDLPGIAGILLDGAVGALQLVT